MSKLNKLVILSLILGFCSLADAAIDDAELSLCSVLSESESDTESDEGSEEVEEEEPDCD